MGWTDSHLQMFTYSDDTGEPPIEIGIAMEPEFDDEIPLLPGWKHKIKRYLTGESSKIEYTYDFGDNWRHKVELGDILPEENGVTYPRCLKGKRACPPEDCGGPWGYPELLEVLADPEHEEHEDSKEWVESMKGGSFEPEHFDPSEVEFSNPKKRFEVAFSD